MPPDSPSRRRYLTVAQDLLSAIANGDYAPGDRLPSHGDIAADAGVSRATAREAFLALELVGSIEVRHGDGTFVKRLAAVASDSGSPLDSPPRDLIEARLSIEPLVAGLAAERITGAQLERLERNVEEAAAIAHDQTRIADFVALGLRFHADLAPTCGNHVLADIVSQLVSVETHPLWALVNQRGMLDLRDRTAQIDEHRKVLSAISNHDSATATTEMRTHLCALDTAMFPHAPRTTLVPRG
ncbi:FadR/GntR family transcriptional regulator [Microbacterium sp. NPDC087589]|uniref:FadR/GntR family transcriptional regulator n=1 Tax=Microbacterium sp. NPDC087589 TaxID=3364191 RepID=UPI0038283C46